MENSATANTNPSTGTNENEEMETTSKKNEKLVTVTNSTIPPISAVLINDEHDRCKNIIEDAEMNHNCNIDPTEYESNVQQGGNILTTSNSTKPNDKIDVQRSIRLARSLTKRPAREDLMQRGILKSTSSSSLTAQISVLERRMKQDIVKHNLQNRPGMEELVKRNIQVNPQLTPALRSKANELEMKMKKHMMEQNLFKRPTPREIRSRLPGVYNSLSEEAKQSHCFSDGGAMKKVYISFVEATLEQLLINEKITTEEYNQLFLYSKNEESEQCKELVNAVKEFYEKRDMEQYERRILRLLQ